MMVSSLFFRTSIIICIIAGVLLIRVPFLNNILLDEEGLFANIVVGAKQVDLDQSSSPFLVARINGKDYLSPPEHPIAPYLVLEKIIRPLFVSADPSINTIEKKSLRARLPFLFIFTVGLLFFIGISYRIFYISEFKTLLLFLSMTFFAMSSRLMVGASIQPQLDGSMGVLMMGMVAFFLTFATDNSRYSLLGCILVGFVGALGKHEWAIAILFSTLFSFFVFLLLKKGSGLFGTLWMVVAIIFGLVIGTGLSYFLSPENYVGGIGVMRATSTSQQSLIHVIVHNFSYFWPLVIIGGLATILIFKKIKSGECPFSICILYVLGVTLFLGFVFVPWMGDGFPRYYAPSIFVMLCTLSILISSVEFKNKYFLATFFVFIAGSLFNIDSLYHSKQQGLSIGSYPGWSEGDKKNQYLVSYKQYHLDHKPAVLDIAYGYYFPDADFVAQSLGEEGARSFIRAHTFEGVKRSA